jgi:cyclic pyranopterin phosphate synthase
MINAGPNHYIPKIEHYTLSGNHQILLTLKLIMQQSQLTDTFGRGHTYLRISLTDACNLRCLYCMPDEKMQSTPHARLMQPDEIEGIAKVFVSLGVNKIRLTGGEPLVRKEAGDIMQRLSALDTELSISTNAVLADEYIEVFQKTGIKKINVSLDTLDADQFKAITRRGDFERIMSNIHLLLSRNFEVKVNMVVMKGINEQAVTDFVSWTRDFPLDVRFIEFMPFNGNDWNREKVFAYSEMLELIGKRFQYKKLEDGVHDTAKKYKVPGHAGTFAFITTITEPFCGGCNRLRLTADGKLKNCLFSAGETDLLGAWRAGQDIIPLILSNVKGKKQERGGQFDFENIENRSMIQIGG